MELTEDNYCDQKPVTMEFTFEEHEILNDMILHAIGSYDFATQGLHDMLVDVPMTSEIFTRYQLLTSLKERSFFLWKNRFN